jgi:hypothetical protein
MRAVRLRALASVAIGLALALSSSACSPYRFDRQVGAFATGVEELRGALLGGVAALRADQAALRRLELAAARPRLAVAGGCSADPETTTAHCRLTAVGTEPESDPWEARLPRARLVADALADYAAALDALTRAADRAQFDGAASQVQVQVKALAAASGQPAAMAAPILFSAGLWVWGQALDAERMATLRWAVRQASTSVPVLAEALGDGLVLIRGQRMTALRRTASELLREEGVGGRTAWLSRYDGAAPVTAALDQVRRSAPREPVADLIKAHDALVRAVEDPRASAADLADAAARFAARARMTRENLAALPAREAGGR